MADMPPFRVPANLPDLVRATFTKAKQSGDVLYFPSEVAVLKLGSVPFQLRFSPSLASKPKGPKPKDGSSKPFNPFESPLPVMTVCDIAHSHVMVLNKFAVVPEHSILATKTFKPQTHVLEQVDVAAAFACIKAYHDAADKGKEEEQLFVFFNSGAYSGASQPHRHLQLLPVARMRDGLDSLPHRGAGWDVLTNHLEEHRASLPFTIFSAPLNPDISDKAIHQVYLDLYTRAVQSLHPEDTAPPPTDGEARINYNLAITKSTMALLPRTAEGAPIKDRQQGEEIGLVQLNGTVLAGTALVKSASEWDALCNDPALLLDVLRQIGVPPSQSQGQDTNSGNL